MTDDQLGRMKLWQVGRAVLERRSDVAAVAAIVVTASLASIAEAGVLVVLSVAALKLVDGSTAAAELPLGISANGLGVGVLVLVGASLVAARLALLSVNAWVTARLSASVLSRWRTRVVASFHGASWERQARDEQGRLQTLVGQNTSQVGALVQQFANALTAGVSFATFVVGAITLAPIAAVGLTLFAVALFFMLRPISGMIRRAADRHRVANQEYSRLLEESATTVNEARVFGVVGRVQSRLSTALHELVQSRRVQMTLSQMAPQLYQAAGLATILFGLWVVDRFDLGNVAMIGALVLLMVRSLNYGQAFQTNYASVVSAEPYVTALLRTLADYDESRPTGGQMRPSAAFGVELRNMSAGYAGKPVIENVSLTIGIGESIGVIGPSGAGKSTLAAVLLGLLEPIQGAYLIDDVDSRTVARDWWPGHVAFVPQEPRLFSGTVGENVDFFRGLPRQTLQRASERAHLGKELNAWSEGLGHQVGPRGSRLSGGQRQRVCIARALAREPAMLVMDEPTSALDSEAEESITRVVADLRGWCTVVIIAHRLSTLETCDRVFLVDAGTVSEIGSGREVRSRDDVFKLMELQREATHLG
jgi:ABC-type multidrug transport system fused ATPase/permease subunit